MTESLIRRIGQHRKQTGTMITEGLMYLAEASLAIQDEATQYDYAIALDELLVALGAPGDMVADTTERPHTDDTRSLKWRLAGEEEAVYGIGLSLVGLTVLVDTIKDEALRNEFRVVLLAFVEKIKGDAPATLDVAPTFKLKRAEDAA